MYKIIQWSRDSRFYYIKKKTFSPKTRITLLSLSHHSVGGNVYERNVMNRINFYCIFI